MTRCAVKGCQNIKPQRKSGNLSFFSFPKDEIVCKAWVKACKNEEVNTKNGKQHNFKKYMNIAFLYDF
jgi:hypothetical protein